MMLSNSECGLNWTNIGKQLVRDGNKKRMDVELIHREIQGGSGMTPKLQAHTKGPSSYCARTVCAKMGFTLENDSKKTGFETRFRDQSNSD